MRRYKALILLIFLSLCILLLTSCRCEPSTVEWHLLEVTEDLAFANGVTAEMTFNGYYGLTSPFGEYASVERCQVEFSKDGGFKMSLDGEELSGTYTYRHNGFSDTSFTVTLDTGESFSGTSVSYYGGDSLEFEFRGVKYEFGERSDDSYTKEEQRDDEEWLVRQLRDHIEGSGGANNYSVNPAEIIPSGEGYVLLYDGQEYDLFSDETLVWCMSLDKENGLTNNAHLRAGDCYFRLTENTYIRGEDGEYYSPKMFLIYYIEPIPDEPAEPERKTAALTELYPWLLGEDIESIKLTRYTQNLPVGYMKHHAYLSGDNLAAYLDALKAVELSEIMSEKELYEHHLVNGENETVTTVTALANGKEYTINFVDEVIFDELMWAADGLPQFPFEGATQSFITYADKITVFDREGKEVGEYSDMLGSVEFTVCHDDHGYTALTPYLTVVTDFGELTVYDACHFWYKGQSYVCTDEHNFGFLFE